MNLISASRFRIPNSLYSFKCFYTYCSLFLFNIFAGEVSLMKLVQRLWWWMPWKRLRQSWKSHFWGMTRKEWLFSWLSLIKSTRSMYETNILFCLCTFECRIDVTGPISNSHYFEAWISFLLPSIMYGIVLWPHIVVVRL